MPATCYKCGYERTGLTMQAQCPECGAWPRLAPTARRASRRIAIIGLSSSGALHLVMGLSALIGSIEEPRPGIVVASVCLPTAGACLWGLARIQRLASRIDRLSHGRRLALACAAWAPIPLIPAVTAAAFWLFA